VKRRAATVPRQADEQRSAATPDGGLPFLTARLRRVCKPRTAGAYLPPDVWRLRRTISARFGNATVTLTAKARRCMRLILRLPNAASGLPTCAPFYLRVDRLRIADDAAFFTTHFRITALQTWRWFSGPTDNATAIKPSTATIA